MFDNLRQQSSATPFEDGKAESQPSIGTSELGGRSRAGRFLGMTAGQRLVIAVLLLVAVCSLGAMCLLVTGKIGF